MTPSKPAIGPILATLGLLSLLAAGVLSAAQDPPRAFVHASRAALRGQPSPTAPVVDYLTTNTEVEVGEKRGDWCAARVTGAARSGFIACQLLGDVKLTLSDVEQKLDEIREARGNSAARLDWEARAFWISPSLTRFVHYAQEMERWLSGNEREEEYKLGRPIRPRSPALDAMKSRLSEEVVAAYAVREDGPPGYYSDQFSEAKRRVGLEPVASSHFVADDVPFVVPLHPFSIGEQGVDLVDALSHIRRTPFRARVVRQARMGNNGAMGAWGIGALGITFTRPVRIEAITASGAVTGADVASMQASLDSYCGDPDMIVNARPLNSRWRTAVLGWVGKPPVAGKIRVASKRHDGQGKYGKLTVETIDLDGDGVPDFSMWSGVEEGLGAEYGERYWRAVFGNVGGRWLLLRFSREVQCT